MIPNWILIATCIVCWGSWSLTQKVATRHMSPMMLQIVAAYVYSAVAPIFFLYIKATGARSDWNVSGVLWTVLACVLITIGGLSFSTVVQRAPVHTVVGFTSVYPVLTFVLSAIFLGESVTLMKLLGVAVIVAGVVLLSF